jgi:hypothetical protein
MNIKEKSVKSPANSFGSVESTRTGARGNGNEVEGFIIRGLTNRLHTHIENFPSSRP